MTPIVHRMKYIILNLIALFLLPFAQLYAEDDGGKLRIMVIAGHPDDAEYKAGGTAVKWAKLGRHVKLVLATNGDLSDRKGTREEIAARREAEVIACVRKLGVTAQVLDIPDGELVCKRRPKSAAFTSGQQRWRPVVRLGDRDGEEKGEQFSSFPKDGAEDFGNRKDDLAVRDIEAN